jgi:hypothetical protein
VDCVEDVANEVLIPDALEPVVQELHDLISPYVEKELSGSSDASGFEAFNTSVQTLMEHINQRNQAALEFLADYQ